MSKLKSIDVVSFAGFQAVLLTPLGLLAGILYSFGGLIIDILVSLGWVATTETPGLSFGTVLAFGALIGMPLIAAVVGFTTGLAEAVIYNWLAKRFGGIEMDFDRT